jgi:hypothetical protein
MLADRREAVHANADGGHVAVLGQLERHAWQCFPPRPRAGSAPCSSRGCASPAAGRISALAVPKLRHSPRSSAGFGVWGAGRRRPENASVWVPPGLGPQEPKAFLGCPASRAMKNPARFPGPGLGTLLKDIFLYLSSVSTSRSQKLQKSEVAQGSQVHHAEVVFGIPRNIC